MLALRKQPSMSSVLLALVTLLLVALGSLTPFKFDLSRISDVGSTVGSGWWLGWPGLKAGDVATNLLVYVPVGASLMLLLMGRFQRFGACFWAVVLASGVSFTLESAQSLIVSRYPSWYDVLFNMAGAATGALVMGHYRIAARRAMGDFRRRLSRAPADTLARMATLGILVYVLLPFNFVATTRALSHSMRQTRMPIQAAISAGRLIPEGPAPHVASGHIFSQEHVLLASTFLILGALTTLARRPRMRHIEAIWAGAGTGALLAILVETLRLFCMWHAFDLYAMSLHILAASLGAMLGGIVMLAGVGSESIETAPADAGMLLEEDHQQAGTEMADRLKAIDGRKNETRVPTPILATFWIALLVLGLAGVVRIAWGGNVFGGGGGGGGGEGARAGGGAVASLLSQMHWRLFASDFRQPFGVAVASLAEVGFGFALLALTAYAFASRLRRRSLQAQILGLSLLAGLGLTVNTQGVPNASHIVIGLLTFALVAAGWRVCLQGETHPIGVAP